MDKIECDYCGQQGHTWLIHPEARQDVRDWERTHRSMQAV